MNTDKHGCWIWRSSVRLRAAAQRAALLRAELGDASVQAFAGKSDESGCETQFAGDCGAFGNANAEAAKKVLQTLLLAEEGVEFGFNLLHLGRVFLAHELLVRRGFRCRNRFEDGYVGISELFHARQIYQEGWDKSG